MTQAQSYLTTLRSRDLRTLTCITKKEGVSKFNISVHPLKLCKSEKMVSAESEELRGCLLIMTQRPSAIRI